MLFIKDKTLDGLTNSDEFEWMISMFDMVLTCKHTDDPELMKKKHYRDDKSIIFLQRDPEDNVR